MSFPIPVFSSRTRLYCFSAWPLRENSTTDLNQTLYPARLTITAPGVRQFLGTNSNSFRRPHLRATRPRIAFNLVFRCHQRFLREQTVVHVLGTLCNGIFHDPVSQRIGGDRR